jgi:hypothetical protein
VLKGEHGEKASMTERREPAHDDKDVMNGAPEKGVSRIR